MSILSDARDFIIKDSNFIQTTNNYYGRSGWVASFSKLIVPRYRYPPRSLKSRSIIWFSRPLQSSLLARYPRTIHHWHHKLGHWICRRPFDCVLDEGPVGVGKSSISQTCTEQLKNTGRIGAAFFFTVNQHNNPGRLFTTIAYELTTALPDYWVAVDERISKDKNVVDKKLPPQFESLAVGPFNWRSREREYNQKKFS